MGGDSGEVILILRSQGHMDFKKSAQLNTAIFNKKYDFSW